MQDATKALVGMVVVAVVAVVMLVVSAGCEMKPMETKYVGTEEDIPLELLIEHEGLKVYRFRDGDRRVYFVDARGKTAWQTNAGNVTEDFDVETYDTQE